MRGNRAGGADGGHLHIRPKRDILNKTTKKPHQEVPVSPQIPPRNPINGRKAEVQVNTSDQMIAVIVLPILDIDDDAVLVLIHHNAGVKNHRKIVVQSFSYL